MNYAFPGSSLDQWLGFTLQGGQPSSVPWGDYLNQFPTWWTRQFLEESPRTAYNAYSTIANTGQSDAFRNWLDNQFNRYYGEYQTAATLNPTLWWTDFLSYVRPYQDFSFTSPFNRGERPSLFAPTMRMLR